jgi:uncharacterized protein DUF4232
MTPTLTRRTLAVAALLGAAALSAGCGAVTQNSSAGPAPTASSQPAAPSPSQPAPSPSASATTSGPVVAPCTSAQLKVSVNTAQAGAAAGSSYYPIDFTNNSGTACTLFGYPGVSFVTSPSGSQIGKPAGRYPAAAATVVTLAPGRAAHATLQVANAANFDPAACQPVTAHWLKIFPPDQFTALYASFTVQACSASHHIGGQIGIYVVRKGAGRAGQGP